MPISAVDSISPAFEHTKQQLFRPFRFGQWTRLALVGLFAGEMSSGGGCNFNIPSHTGTTHRDFAFVGPPNWALLGPLLAIALITLPLIGLLLIYLNSRMRFVLFDSVIAKKCELGRMWRERREPALQYFVWQIVFVLATLAGMAVLIGVPALAAFLLGWFTAPRQHLAPLILTGIFVFFAFMFWMVASIVVQVFTKDFVVPQMALENLSAFEGWRRLWRMLGSEKGSYAGYGGMKVILTIGAGIGIGILAFIVIIILLIPFGGLGAITVLAGKAAGLTWNVFTITAAVVAGSIFLMVAFYAIALVSVPVIVFFPAYSIYFFAARYPLLARLMYPPPPLVTPAPPTTPAPEPAG
ncbi:MAG: hypothetical protein JWN74_3818 [Acidobacteriaceae bacterium]|nr:hypothetical protein [Acidobacteriaceae bacterium]